MERLDEHGIERYNQISALAIAYMKVCIRKGLSHRDIMSIINTAYDAHGREYT